MSISNRQYEEIKRMLKESAKQPVKVNDITIGEIERLCVLSHENQVEINVTVRPDEVEIGIEPWESTVMENSSRVTPSVKIESKLP